MLVYCKDENLSCHYKLCPHRMFNESISSADEIVLNEKRMLCGILPLQRPETLSCSLPYPWHLKQCFAHSKHWVKNYWMHECYAHNVIKIHFHAYIYIEKKGWEHSKIFPELPLVGLLVGDFNFFPLTVFFWNF